MEWEAFLVQNPVTLLSDAVTIAWKDLTEYRRNRITLIFSIVFPILMMGMIGLIFQDSTSALNDTPVGLVMDDNGVYGEHIKSLFTSIASESDAIRIVQVSTQSEVNNMILAGDIKAAIVVPNNFSSSIQKQTQAQVLILTDPSNPTIAQGLTQYLGNVVIIIADQFSREFIVTGIPILDPDFVLHPIALNVETIVPGGGSSFDFVAPGFIAMNVMMSGLTALGAALARERESGTLAGVLMAPIARTSIILGKTISFTLRNLFQGAITITMAILVFGITIRGNPLLIAAILIIGTISFLGLGIVATVITKEQESAQLVLGLLQFPMMFLSGVLFPIEQMPSFLQSVSKVLPLTYAVDALRKVMILGAGIEAVILPITILIVLGVVTMMLGVPLFDRAVKR
jgi:ABC-2 type transport system permease protein